MQIYLGQIDWVPDIVLDVLQHVKCQTSSSNMQVLDVLQLVKCQTFFKHANKEAKGQFAVSVKYVVSNVIVIECQ